MRTLTSITARAIEKALLITILYWKYAISELFTESRSISDQGRLPWE